MVLEIIESFSDPSLGKTSLEDLINDKFGNYVIQRVIEVLTSKDSLPAVEEAVRQELLNRFSSRISAFFYSFKRSQEDAKPDDKQSAAKHVFGLIQKRIPQFAEKKGRGQPEELKEADKNNQAVPTVQTATKQTASSRRH